MSNGYNINVSDNLRKLLLSCSACILMIISTLGAQEIERYSLLIFPVENVSQLQDLGLAAEGRAVDNQFQVIVNQAELKKLQRTNLSYKVEIEDITAHYNANIKMTSVELQTLQKKLDQQYAVKGFELGSMGGYYTYEQIVSELDSMRLLYPDLISEKASIGLSLEGKDIWHVKISDNAGLESEEPEILYTALHHAREAQSMATVIYFMYYLLENYGKDPQVNYIVGNRQLHFIPVVNPDGYIYNQTISPGGGGMWRKNRRDNGDNSFGVDLNRNYSYQWAYDNVGSSADPSSWGYRGTGPFSEPETQAVRDFCESHQIKLCLNYHTYGGHLIYPWTYIDLVNPDVSLYQELAASMTEINNYDYGTGYETLRYIFNGSATDWMYGEQVTKNKIISMTPEVGPAFWPSPALIYPLAEENVQANMLLAIGSGIINTDRSPQILNITAELKKPDSIFTAAKVSNPNGEVLTVHAYIDNSSKTYLDTIQLYDDGTHGDGNPDDLIFSRTIPEPSIDGLFNLHGYLAGSNGGTHFFTELNSFTTFGPIVYEGWSWYIYEDSIPNPGDMLGFKLYLTNNGRERRIDEVEARLYSNDPRIEVLNFWSPFGNISAGETVKSTNGYRIQISPDFTQDTTIYLPLEISSSEEYLSWSDSMRLDLSVTDISEGDTKLPAVFFLDQNYPNPFNPKTVIRYQVGAGRGLPVQIDLSIYNNLGQKVKTLVSKKQPAGSYKIEWDAAGFSSGVYYCVMKTDTGFFMTRKLLLLK